MKLCIQKLRNRGIKAACPSLDQPFLEVCCHVNFVNLMVKLPFFLLHSVRKKRVLRDWIRVRLLRRYSCLGLPSYRWWKVDNSFHSLPGQAVEYVFYKTYCVCVNTTEKEGKAEKKGEAGVGRQGRTALVKAGVYFMVCAKNDNFVVI